MIEKIILRYLSLKSFSRFELRKKLTRRGFEASEIEEALEKFVGRGYINDPEIAERRTELYKAKGYGPRWIALKLKSQGLRRGAYSIEEQVTAISRLLKTPPFARRERNQQIAALERRGFDLETIFRVIKD